MNKKHQTIYSLIFCLGLLFMLHSQIHADDFYPTASIDECKLATNLAVQYNNLPTDIQYNPGLIAGEKSPFIQSNDINKVADITFPDARRYSGIADEVRVPPNTSVEFGAFTWNYSGHDIDSNELKLFTSRNNPGSGNLTRLGAGGVSTDLRFDVNNSRLRSGLAVTLPGLGLIHNRIADKGKVIYSFKTIQPIAAEKLSLSSHYDADQNLVIDYSYRVKNNSSYNVCNIDFEDNLPDGTTYKKSLCLNATTYQDISYQALIKSQLPAIITDSGPIVRDNNTYTEVSGDFHKNQNDIYNFEARTLYVKRNDNTAPNWYAYQPAWGQVERNLVKISIIPYSFHLPASIVTPTINLSLKKYIIDGDNNQLSQIDLSAGSIINYKLVITNNGPTANSVNLSDQLNREDIVTKEANWPSSVLLDLASKEQKVITYTGNINQEIDPGDYAILNTAKLSKDDINLSASATVNLKVYPKPTPEQISVTVTQKEKIINDHKPKLAKTGFSHLEFISGVIEFLLTLTAYTGIVVSQLRLSVRTIGLFLATTTMYSNIATFL
jgi:uncharacterized repeat protein (TIGR01451 family)